MKMFLVFFPLLQAANVEDEEFNLFLFSLLIMGLIFVCLCIIITILITVLCLLIIFGFIAMGALSASAIIGISKRSFTSGFRSFVLIFSTLGMTVLGGLTFWILNRIVHWWSQSTAITAGLVAGFAGGLVVGIVVAYLVKIFSTFLKNRLDNRLEGHPK